MRTQTAGIISAIAIFAIILTGFVPTLTTLNVNALPYSTTITTSRSYTAVVTGQSASVSTWTTTLSQQSASISTATTFITQQSVTTITSQPFYIPPQTLQCGTNGGFAYSSASLNAGTDVQSVSFSASNGLYLFIFNSAQYSTFVTSGNGGYNSVTSPNEGEIDNQASGTVSFHVSQSDTYYFVLWLKPGATFGCYGISNVGIISTSSHATYTTTVSYTVTSTYTQVYEVTIYSTQTNSQVYIYTTTGTQTFYNPSTYTSVQTSTTTKTCTLGWLQALFGCH